MFFGINGSLLTTTRGACLRLIYTKRHKPLITLLAVNCNLNILDGVAIGTLMNL